MCFQCTTNISLWRFHQIVLMCCHVLKALGISSVYFFGRIYWREEHSCLQFMECVTWTPHVSSLQVICFSLFHPKSCDSCAEAPLHLQMQSNYRASPDENDWMVKDFTSWPIIFCFIQRSPKVNPFQQCPYSDEVLVYRMYSCKELPHCLGCCFVYLLLMWICSLLISQRWAAHNGIKSYQLVFISEKRARERAWSEVRNQVMSFMASNDPYYCCCS